ncbi:hypothetical protein TNCV_210901 [Trichonephila clavipes]|uniref:Uncharacterized protein n=1 Tax=Trichonephila clavipes TaxID=2585209 RepID=A0A8X6SZE9_TRICX|nr:hypothetical protein TNCV_210901 [Trichonephila clavipes]
MKQVFNYTMSWATIEYGIKKKRVPICNVTTFQAGGGEVRPFILIKHPGKDGYFQQDYAPFIHLELSPDGSKIMTKINHAYLAGKITRSQSYRESVVFDQIRQLESFSSIITFKDIEMSN